MGDTKGNKYKFKNESVTCTEADNRYGYYFICEGSAIKKDIAGGREVVEFPNTVCYKDTRLFICIAGKKLGKVVY